MDYEKKYKEAFEKAKEYHKFSVSIPEDMAMLESIFPELKEESEDERIKKMLRDVISQWRTGNQAWCSDVKLIDATLAWLEKQGQVNESLTSEDERTWIINYLRYKDLNSSILEEKKNLKKAIAWLEKQESVGEIVSRCKTSWYNEGKIQRQIEGLSDDEKYQQGWHDALEKQGEQKPDDNVESTTQSYITPNQKFFQWIYDRLIYVHNENPNVDYMLSLKERIKDMQKPFDYENANIQQKDFAPKVEQNPAWSEEDEEHIKSLLERLEGMCKKGVTLIMTRFAVSEDEDWLKSLKDRVQPQPKPKWSEEDEKMRAAVLQLINDSEKENGWNCIYCNDKEIYFSDIIDWLKSLRPQNRWKPSESDILLLERIANGKSDPQDFQATLCCLIEQLKKLKG